MNAIFSALVTGLYQVPGGAFNLVFKPMKKEAC
jgi:hypothetical protein